MILNIKDEERRKTVMDDIDESVNLILLIDHAGATKEEKVQLAKKYKQQLIDECNQRIRMKNIKKFKGEM